MAGQDVTPISDSMMLYSIQRTYIIKPTLSAGKSILACEQRIDIPTIEPLPNVQTIFNEEQALTVIPCIELAGEFLSEFNLTFETNEGVTVLPVKIRQGELGNIENPYMRFRYVLVLPRGATGVKSCKLIHQATSKEVQHNFTFGIMPPPYNYDNVLFSYNTGKMFSIILGVVHMVRELKLTSGMVLLMVKELPKKLGEQNIEITSAMLYFPSND